MLSIFRIIGIQVPEPGTGFFFRSGLLGSLGSPSVSNMYMTAASWGFLYFPMIDISILSEDVLYSIMAAWPVIQCSTDLRVSPVLNMSVSRPSESLVMAEASVDHSVWKLSTLTHSTPG